MSTSIVQVPPLRAYTKPDLPSAKNRKAVLAGGTDSQDPSFQVKGDTYKAALALYRLSELPSPPLRLMLGKESAVGARAKAASLLEDAEKYASWSEGLERDEYV